MAHAGGLQGLAGGRDALVTVSDVWRTFDEEQGLRGLDLVVPPGRILGLIGPSGSGKTTAVRLVLGTDTPERGEVRVFGVPPGDFTREHRQRIGFLPQHRSLYPELSLRHNLQLVASLYGMPLRSRFSPGRRAKQARRRVDEVLELLELTDRQQTRLEDASGGEQRRLALAAALVHRPQLLVLDEPTAGVDPVLRRRIWEELLALRDDGTTLFVTTQYVEEAAHCDLVAFLADGRLLTVGSPDELRREAYGEAPPEQATFDDVFVTLIERHRAAQDGGARG